MQTRIVAIMMICFVALSGATAVSGGVSYTSLDSMNENNVTEVSVNATPTVSNSKQRRQYRLAYVSWKNRIADLRMSAIFKWLRTEYYPSLVSIADAASSGSSGVSFARDSMTIQDAWWDLDETMDMDLHRDSDMPFIDALGHLEAACNALHSAKQSGQLSHYDYEQMNGKIANLEEDVRKARKADIDENIEWVMDNFQDDARDSKTWNFSIEIHSPSGGTDGSRLEWGYDFLLNCIINAFDYFDMLIRVTYEDEKHGDVVVVDQISDGARDSIEEESTANAFYRKVVEILDNGRDGVSWSPLKINVALWHLTLEYDGCFDVSEDEIIENLRARDSNDLEGNYDETCCGFVYNQFKDFNVNDLNYCVCCGSEFVLPDARDSFDDAFEHLMAASDALLSVRNTTFSGFTKEYQEALRMPHSVYEKLNAQIARLEEDIRMEMRRQEIAYENVANAPWFGIDLHDARDSKQLLKDMPRLPVLSRLEILEKARINLRLDYLDYLSGGAKEHLGWKDWLGNFHNYDIEIPVNRFSFFKQLDIISDWACDEYRNNYDGNTEINSWKMPSFEDNGIDDRERRGSILVTISRRGLEVADALHQMKVAQEVLDGARDSKYMVVSSQDGDTFGACEVQGSGKYRFVHFRGSQTYPADQIRFKTKDEAIEFLCRSSGHYSWVKSDYYVKSWWNGVDGKLYNYSECHKELQRMLNYPLFPHKYNARDSVVGMLHLKCNHTGRCGEVFAVDADEYIGELIKLALDGNGSFQYPKRDCPFCVARDSADSDSHTIDLTPTPKGYARMLEVVIKGSPIAADVEWATAELNKMKMQKRRSQFKNDESMDLTVSCNCGCGYTTRLEGQFPMALGVESYYCSWIPARDSRLLYSSDLKSEQVDGQWKHTFTVDDVKVIMGSPNHGHFKCSVQRKDPVLEITGCYWEGDSDRLPHNIKFDVETSWDNPEYVDYLDDDYDEDEHWNIEEHLDAQDEVTITLEHGIHDAQAYLDGRTLEPEIQQAIEAYDGFEIMINIAQAIRSACYMIYSEGRECNPVARDSAWDDEKLSYAIELLSEKDLIKYQEWVDSQEGYWNGDGTISFANANAKLDYDMRELRHEKLQSDMGYCRETELLI